MNIIFLDFDGVLNSVRNTVARDRGWSDALPRNKFEEESLDPVAVDLLRRLCINANAKIVVSSTWRIGRSAKDFEDIFSNYGWRNVPLIGMTPKMNTNRGTEIAAWIKVHLDTGGELTRYVIIDDDSDMLPTQADNFVHTDVRDGFLLRDYIKALRILDDKNPDLSPMSLGGYE